ncbi:helix-turn-helix domain-containing protein [Allopontixanthobacter sp.]|uniref:winged helix-turn-helix transcriptional regulator n=1 Tax=Allopontixanthobacter sp. TaxID=2906452 RepID=UPI002ABB4F06|nr:helix-turn-helix domain-containing protein [Allopontixanthobacter sp.]MDZ4308344.1 helix-turn-helix domain-containing protein [Allopontixanthobacter sp.]
MQLQKETKAADQRSHGRWYDDACGTAFALEVIGERWALLIVRELMFGGRRFSDLRRCLPGISAKILTERLESLETSGVVRKVLSPPPLAARLYELTEWGALAEPMLQELGRWAARSTLHDPTMPLSPVSLMLSMRTMIDRDRARLRDADYGFAVGGEEFVARLEDGILAIRRSGDFTSMDCVFRAGTAPPLAAAFYGDVPFEHLEDAGLLEITGSRDAARHLAGALELPPKAV